MDIIGHRGCADQYPENTVAAVERSGRYVDGVEIDVRRCGTGELVVFHDERVDRLTDGTGRVADLPWSELRTLEVMDSGESIPHLGAAMAAVPRGVRAQIELKEAGLAADVRAVASEYDLDVWLSSFQRETVAEVHDLPWDVPTGLLFETDPDEHLATARELDTDAVHPHYDCCLETDVVTAAQSEGFSVVAWKAAKTREEIATLRELGVDGVTADRWDIA